MATNKCKITATNEYKAYTSIEQSMKLAEILPIESADMEYILEQWEDEKTHRHMEGYCEIPVVKVEDDCPIQPITLPCWSLSALLGVLPAPDLVRTTRGTWRLTAYDANDYPRRNSDSNNSDPVDACYEVVFELYSRKLL